MVPFIIFHFHFGWKSTGRTLLWKQADLLGSDHIRSGLCLIPVSSSPLEHIHHVFLSGGAIPTNRYRFSMLVGFRHLVITWC